MDTYSIDSLLEIFPLISNIVTTAASAIAIYVYFKNRGKISFAVQLLLNHSFQTTISELKEKLERLNEYNANELEHHTEIRSILHEIAGQIRGNRRLIDSLPDLPAKIEKVAQHKKLTEPMRRSIVSEVREQLRTCQINMLNNVEAHHHE